MLLTSTLAMLTPGAGVKPRGNRKAPGFQNAGVKARLAALLLPKGTLGGAWPRTGKVGSDQSLLPQRPLCSELL